VELLGIAVGICGGVGAIAIMAWFVISGKEREEQPATAAEIGEVFKIVSLTKERTRNPIFDEWNNDSIDPFSEDFIETGSIY
jgi:hypothetical protein